MERQRVECQGAVWETRNVLCRSYSHLGPATRAGSADDDELYRRIPQQGDAGATAALCRATPSMGILSTSSQLLPGTDTPPFLGLSEQSRFDATMPTPITARRPAGPIGQSLLLESARQKLSSLTRKLSRVNCAARFLLPLSRLLTKKQSGTE